LGETDAVASSFLQKNSEYSNLSANLFDDLCRFERDQFELWVEDMKSMIDDEKSEVTLQKKGKLMELDFTTGKLKVNYGSKLVTMLREVRQLMAMGFAVPIEIQKVAEKGEKFYRHGVVLQQVATFYNTIDQQMLPSQQPMMLGAALEFEKLVKSPTHGKSDGITWENPKDLENYVAKLQFAAEKLTSENRRLRNYHSIVVDHVKTLMSIDLIKNQHNWKDVMNSIRGIINSILTSGVKSENTQTWRNHLDYQLYKAMEFQYQVGLETLSENLSELKVEVIYKNQCLQFRPPFEEIKSKYFREMKKFINLPATFKPLGETDIFSKMVEQNSKSLLSVYHKADVLFQSLSKVLDIFKDWMILGTVDLDTFVENALDEISDWELNFKMLKQKGKESEQLPLNIKIDCITVSTTPVKTAIDDHLQRLFDSLSNTLRKGAAAHLLAIDQFTNTAMELLLQRPQSIADIGNANSIHSELSRSKSAIEVHFENLEQKNKLLKSVTGHSVDSSVAKAKWSKLELMLESHELMIKEQVDMLRGAIDSRIQNFFNDLDKFILRWNQLKPNPAELENLTLAAKSVEIIDEKLHSLIDLKTAKDQIISDCSHFGIEQPDFSSFDSLENDMLKSKDAWNICQEYVAGIQKFAEQDWISSRGKCHLLEVCINEWKDKMSELPLDTLTTIILKDIDKMKSFLPSLKYFRGDSWISEHWGEFFRLASIPKGVTLSELTFGHILDAKDSIMSNIQLLIDLNSRADGEVMIRDALQELDIWGASALFALLDYQTGDGRSIKLIKEWKETLTQVGDNQSLLLSLKDSPFFQNFAEKAAFWEVRLAETDEYLRQLNNIQRKWVYLEPIFNRGALPSEQGRFSGIDEDFKEIMGKIAIDPRVITIATFGGIKNSLLTLADQLDRCQKALNEFLENKRSKFARFYFLGDDDLLEILGQSTNPEVIQSHLKKLFAGVHTVIFDNKCSHVIGMKSIHGEIVMLKVPVKITGDVEIWLENFSNEMKNTLHIMLQECLKENDIFKYPNQVVVLSEYLHFTADVEKVIQSGLNFSELQKKLKHQLDTYTSFDYHSIEDSIERAIAELKIKSLILDVIHFLDVLDQLKKKPKLTDKDWIWKKQIRFYLGPEKKCVIRMHDAQFDYSYEYQGIPPKLVHTPLTDKCYLTLTQAMASGFGGNPFGPAGTGKTESVKALGVLFGRQVLVFNCDEGIDYKSMGRIFVGLVKCGAWGCFDEFNRLEEAVLSAVSQQIQVIQAALKKKETSIKLLDKEVDLNHNSGIFVTLNPAGKGYGGRQKLPDNLKQLFRSVAMTHPNFELIAEVILLSEGFDQGKLLGSKVVSIFNLSKQFLSPQQHYDWGLRPMKAVLSLAGNLIHEERKKNAQIDEAAIIVKALCTSIVSKLTFNDVNRFNLLLKDLFPNVKVENISYSNVKNAVIEAFADLDLIYIESQAEKVFQLYEACRQRMGVVLVGPSGSSKSTIWKILDKAIGKMGKKLTIHKSNPKAVERQILLGNMDIDTREWTDGILTFASRQAVKEPLENHTWIICDGDVDPEWVESLNSVLDDNRLLTMPSGERIQFGPNVNFIFETHNLKYASPATVSRMGMIYLSDETLDVSVIVDQWLMKQSQEKKNGLKVYVNDFLYPALDYLMNSFDLVVETTKMSLLFAALSHLRMCENKLSFLHGLIKGLGSNITLENRLKFATFVLKLGNSPCPDPKRALDYYVNKKGVFELYERDSEQAVDMSNFVELDKIPAIETPDLRRNVDIILPWLKEGSPVLLVGPEGAGKTTTMRYCFSKLKNIAVSIIHCSSETNSHQVLQRLYQTCILSSSTTGRVLRPKDAERLILYLKDINLPGPDKYETVELVQLLQQLLTYDGFFDHSLEWISIENIQIVASMNPSSTIGRHQLSTRFTSKMRICFISYPDKEQLQSIYKALLEPVLRQTLPGHQVWSLPKNISKFSQTLVNIYIQTAEKFTVDMQSHYIFTPRDISRLLISLFRYKFTSNNEKQLLEVIAYEYQRLFQDKLVGNDHKLKFQTILQSVLKSEWDFQEGFDGYVYSSQNNGISSSADLSSHATLIKQQTDDYKTQITKKLALFEAEVQDVNLHLFPELLGIISRIERVLSQIGGSILLAGRPGISFYRLVSFCAHSLGFKLFSMKVSPSYNKKLFLVDLKQAIQVAAIDNVDATFVMEDYQIVDSSFLEIINNLLSGAEIGGIYTKEELDVMSSTVKDSMSAEGFRGTTFEYLSSRIRRNLHVILIFDSASSEFSSRCESNPALYTRCQMVWIDSWSTQSKNVLISTKLALSPIFRDIKDKDEISEFISSIHQSCIDIGATSKHFFGFLEIYENVYKTQRNFLLEKKNYLEGGLNKLKEATSYVDKLSVNARLQQKELTSKQFEADEALKEITQSMVQATEQKKEMEKLNEHLANEEIIIIARKKAVETELAEVEPIINSAKCAVGEIRSESLSEIKSLRSPPPAVRDVLEAVLRLMGNLDMSWNSMKAFLGQRTVKEEILNFDARTIKKSTRDAVADILKKNGNSFEESVIKRASVAAAPLAMWVKANIQYSLVLDKVGPLENDLKRLTDSLIDSKNRVELLKTGLLEVDKKVELLRNNFTEKTREAETLRLGLEKALGIMERAQGLLEKLSGEGMRWNTQSSQIQSSLNQLPISALLSSAFIIYLAGAPEDIRSEYQQKWKQVTKQEKFSFKATMCSESEQLIWKSEGLPSDELSIENAIIVKNSVSVPLLIDPSGQSVQWLKVHLKDKKPEVVNYGSENFNRSLELAVRFGKTLIVQEISEIDPVLFPLIRKVLIKHGPRYVIELGDKTIDYNEDFKLYLVCRKSAFRIPTNIVGYINDINFTITRAGLAGQLLGITLRHEKPELEIQKLELIQKEESLKLQLNQLENQLLNELANAEGNILENMALIQSLNEAKEKSSVVEKSLQESFNIQISLDNEREKYSSISIHGSALYFVMCDMPKLNNMYQFSLNTFLCLFEKALKTKANNESLDSRNQTLLLELEKLFFMYLSKSIFKTDRVSLALHIIKSIHSNMFEPNEWDLFTGQAIFLENAESGVTPQWIPEDRRSQYEKFKVTSFL
jgi:dynein heavy chain 2